MGKGGQHEEVRIIQSHACLLAECVESNGNWTADSIVEMVVLPDDLICCVTEGSLPGRLYPGG
ncbi:hypothetical protein E2C01_039963 [Portunus trituberculatus]|uniref:Uncharacterized protein n=1 Tax=Portunus trituberculatus TaxID=210409 RepID=A0A5B7FM15_PORTR|nr:hypothetical protein [Portunus trituberculatus]